MTLSLEIEFLTGCCRAAQNPSSETPDWPPQPDRIFSALVASWAARGSDADEQAALEWLERQPPPVLHASRHEVRTAPDVFVPPNDFRASCIERDVRESAPGPSSAAASTVPSGAAARSGDARGLEPPTPHLTYRLLNAIANDVTYLGHSTSLVRCRFMLGELRFVPRSC